MCITIIRKKGGKRRERRLDRGIIEKNRKREKRKRREDRKHKVQKRKNRSGKGKERQ